MRCAQSSAYFRIIRVFSGVALGVSLVSCSSESLHTEEPILVTRMAEVPACKETGIAPLSKITPAELSPEEPLSRRSMQEIRDAASRLGANYVVVNPSPIGPQAFGFRCG
jgi:hypothetical protein